MENNRKVIWFAMTAIVIALVGYVVFAKKTEAVGRKEGEQLKEKIVFSGNTPDASNHATDNVPSALDATPPNWAKSMILINDHPAYSREDKIPKLVALLKQNQSNPEALNAILISLMVLDPIEVADDIIPYLKNKNPKVQSAALGALHNASLLTPQEHKLKRSLAENEAVRKRIAVAVNELKEDPNTTEEVKQALMSTYIATDPSLKSE